jgi:hypothetical protein
MAQEETKPIHAVLFQSGSGWVAQCLEHDIATQAPTLDGLLLELERILVAHVVAAAEEHHPPFDDLPKAPRRFWEMYEAHREHRFTCNPAEVPTSLLQAVPRLEAAWAR